MRTFILSLICFYSFAQKKELVIGQINSGIITLTYLDSGFQKSDIKKIDISSFEGWLTSSNYSATHSYSPIQFTQDASKLVMSLTKNSEIEGITYWTKYLRYDLVTSEFEEIAVLEGTDISFWYLVNDRQIVGLSGKLFFQLDLVTNSFDTLYSYDYYARPLELLVDEESVSILIEGKNNLSSLRYDLESRKVEEIFYAPTLHYSSINGDNLLTIEGIGTNTLKLRKSGLYAMVAVEKTMNLNNFNSYWDSDENIYLMTKTGIIKVDNNLEKVDKLNCKTPHIKAIVNDQIIYSTRRFGSDVRTAKHFASSLSFDKTIELDFLNGTGTLILIKD